MAELLLELLSEEIPARMQKRAAEELRRLVLDQIKSAGLLFDRAESFVTPRRLTLVVEGIRVGQIDTESTERRGPRMGAPPEAIEGFLKSVGAKGIDECEQRDTPRGRFWFAKVKRPSLSIQQILSLSFVFRIFPWPKSMRWLEDEPENRFVWVRPLRRVVCLLDGEELPELPGWTPKNLTEGHRFMAPGPIQVSSFADYRAKLTAAFVTLDPAERRERIREEANELATHEGLTVKPDDALLDEVVGLVEWPAVLMGRIDEAYMALPPEVLTTSMRTNQKYFALLDRAGKLAPCFLLVSNMPHEAERDRTIVAGNERVLRARLSDAKFFWDQDRKMALADRVPALRDIIFHARLGTMAEKVERLRALAAELVPALRNSYRVDTDADEFARHTDRAALLCKADLTTGMVGEFPELQGIMGRYYARHDGEPASVADAIADHYSPLGPTDRCPTAPVAVAVALADKIDTLAGFFAFGERPTGSKDPYALRRAALGIIRLIVDNKIRLPLTTILHRSLVQHAGILLGDQEYVKYLSRTHLNPEELEGENIEANWEHGLVHKVLEREASTVVAELLDFFADRLKVALRGRGVRHDLVSSVFSKEQRELVSEVGVPGAVDLVRVLNRVEALRSFLDREEGADLLTAYRRASNIVRIESKRDNREYPGNPDEELLVQEEERDLSDALGDASQQSVTAVKEERFEDAMATLARLRHPIDAFFNHVTVNCDDPQLRQNRLELLARIQWTMDEVADFSRIEG